MAREASEQRLPKEQEVPTVSIPRFEFLDEESVDHKIPEGLNMNPQQFLEFSEALGANLVRGVEALNGFVSNNPEDSDEHIRQFTSSFAEFLSEATPDTKRIMEEFNRDWDGRPDKLISQINKFLHPAGWHMQIRTNPETKKLKFGISSIKRTSKIKVSKKEGRQSIGIYHVGENIVDESISPKRDSTLGTIDPNEGIILFFEDDADRAALEIMRGAREKELLGDFDYPSRFIHGFTQDCLRHEATHITLGQEYPNTTANLDLNNGYGVPLAIVIDGGLTVDLGGVYTQFAFHELCAVGMQIAASTDRSPYTPWMYTAQEQGENYELVNKVIRLLILKFAPESDLKRNLIEYFKSTQRVDQQGIEELLRSDDYTHDRLISIGAMMYHIGDTSMARAEKGQLHIYQRK